MWNDNKVLVAGGAGFVGANVVKRLLELGADVRATLYKDDAQIDDDRVEYVRCNLEEKEACEAVCKDVDYVFMCAANTQGAYVVEHTPLAHLTPNVIMNARILEAAHAAGVKKFLWLSSNAVYPVTDFAVKETDVTDEFYEKYFIVAWMKRFTEHMCEMYATKIKQVMQTIIIRPGNIYGPLDNFDLESSHVLPALIRKVVERHDPIEVWGTGENVKDFVYIDDFVDGLFLAMEQLDSFDVLNLSSGEEYVLKDVLDLIIKLDGYDGAQIVFNTSKPDMIKERFIDSSKAEALLGYRADTSMEEGMKRTIEWYRTECA